MKRIQLPAWLRATSLTLASFFLVGVSFAHADTTTSGSGALNTDQLVNFFQSVIDLINTIVVPLVFAIAFVVFLWGVYTYFIAGGASEEKRKEGTQFVFWAIIGFVIMISLWGIVNLVNGTLPLNGSQPKLPSFDSTTGSPVGGDGSTCTPACGQGFSCDHGACVQTEVFDNCTPACTGATTCQHGECVPIDGHGACIGGLYADGTPC